MTDLFPVTADPKRYVPRRASEWALAALVDHIDRLSPAIALTGPAGIGKTLLLRVLSERIRHRLECVLVPYSALGPEEFAIFVLGLMDEPTGSDPEAALLEAARAREAEGTGLALLVDDAASLPRETASMLVELACRSEGALRLIAVTDDEGAAGFLAATSGQVQVVRFAAPMSLDETEYYLRACLEQAKASPALQARFDAAAIRRLHLESGGIPGALHACALELLAERQAGAGPADLPRPAVEGVSELAPTLLGRWRSFVESSVPLTRVQIFAAALFLGLSAVAVTRLRPEIEIPPVEIVEQTEPRPVQVPPPVQVPEPEPEVPVVPIEPISVNVNATPWAQVSVDGVDVGVTPLAGLPLLPGRHIFKARFPDGRVQQRLVEITDEQRHVSFDTRTSPDR